MSAKFLTRKELEKLIDENDESVRFVKKKKNYEFQSRVVLGAGAGVGMYTNQHTPTLYFLINFIMFPYS